jgi:Domain of unknown function (DUF4394)
MKPFTTVAALAFALAVPALASAETAVGLTSDNMLIRFDTESRAAMAGTRITGIEGRVVGIDVRPADRQLYAITDANIVYRVAPMTGAATMVSRLQTPLELGAGAVVDFNPVANRLRVVGANGRSYRINVDDGMVTVDQPLRYDGGAAGTPRAVAGGYSNSMAGAQRTALYQIDATSSQFMIQDPPNDGVLKPVGALGVTVQGAVAFDIVTDAQGANRGFAVWNRRLFRVDVATGRLSEAGALTGLNADLIDIAVLPPG